MLDMEKPYKLNKDILPNQPHSENLIFERNANVG